MKVVEYVAPLGFDGRRRVRHTRFEGKVTEFMVQYEIFVKEKWYEVVRYDTSHGYAHRDLMHADGFFVDRGQKCRGKNSGEFLSGKPNN